MSRYLLGVLSVRIRYTYPRNGIIYYQRAVPIPLRSRYPFSRVKHRLHSTDPVRVKRDVERLNQQYEAEWALLLSDPTASPASTQTHAKALLREWGLTAKGAALKTDEDEIARELLHDHLDDRRYSHVEKHYENSEDPEVFNNVPASDYLTPVELEAVRLLNEEQKPSIRDALTFYFKRHPKGQNEEFQKLPQMAVDQFIAVIGGDKAFDEVSREDVHRWMEKCVSKGNAKGTIQRRLNSLKAVFSLFIREKELGIQNRFEKHTIPGGAKKAKKRTPLTEKNLMAIQSACRVKDDDVRWATALLSDTCSRLAEIVGLRLADIVLDAPIPYINIEEHEARSLKTKESDTSGDDAGYSERVIPLVGVALWAAQRIKATATKGQVFAFPRYIKEGKCNADAASAAINKWLRSQHIDHTTHEFRHTMADRLRDVGCPKEVRDQIGGWARKDLSEGYGTGHTLQRTREWLDKVVLKEKPEGDA